MMSFRKKKPQEFDRGRIATITNKMYLISAHTNSLRDTFNADYFS